MNRNSCYDNKGSQADSKSFLGHRFKSFGLEALFKFLLKDLVKNFYIVRDFIENL